MLKFYGEKCPVCGKEFVKDDDIVVCPICGTPHHRECYEKENRCANEFRHGTSWEWKGENDQTKKPQNNAPSNEKEQPKLTTAEIMANQLGINFNSNDNKDEDGKIIPETDEIDGVQTQHLMFYLRKNPGYFLYKWKRNKDKKFFFSFNWSAFLFSFVYYYYRKMYRVGSVILLGIALSLIPSFSLTMKVMPQLLPHAGEIMLNPAIIANLINLDGLENLAILAKVCSLIPFILTFIGAMIFDCLYRKKVVKETKQIIKSGGDARMLLVKGGVSMVNALFIICFTIFMFYFTVQLMAIGL